MRRDFLETLGAANRKDTGLLLDVGFVAFGCLDFVAVCPPDYEHDVSPHNRWAW